MSQIQSPVIAGKCLVIHYMSTKSSHLAARLLLAIVLLAAMLDCQGTVQYRYCTGACVPAPAVCLFTAGTVPVRPPTADTRQTQGNPSGKAAGVYTGVPGERRLPLLA